MGQYQSKVRSQLNRGRGGVPQKIEMLFVFVANNNPSQTKPKTKKKMEAYPSAVMKVLTIYVNKATAMTEKEQKLVCIAGFFDYLSTADVKPLLNTSDFANFRNMILKKIHEFSHDPYLLARRPQYHRLFAVFCELFTYLVPDNSLPRRRSERQKQRAVRHFNQRFALCSSPECVSIANELKTWNAVRPNATAIKPVSIKVKVLPRRSARLMNKL